MRIGLIDIGSNTSKLLIVEKKEPFAKEPFDVLEHISLPCRLYTSSPEQNFRIDQASIKLLINSLQVFLKSCDQYSVKKIRAVATEALRKSANSSAVIKFVQAELGLEIDVLSGTEEAKAVARGLQTDPIISQWQDYLAMDIGGGSIELIEISGKKIKQVQSLPLGAVRVAHSSLADPNSQINADSIRNARNYVSEILARELEFFPTNQRKLVATGGTIIYLRKILEKEKKLNRSSEIDCKDIIQIADQLSGMTKDERVFLFPDIPSERADIFPFGLLTIIEIMNFLGIESLTHSFHNLRYGLVNDLFESD